MDTLFTSKQKKQQKKQKTKTKKYTIIKKSVSRVPSSRSRSLLPLACSNFKFKHVKNYATIASSFHRLIPMERRYCLSQLKLFVYSYFFYDNANLPFAVAMA